MPARHRIPLPTMTLRTNVKAQAPNVPTRAALGMGITKAAAERHVTAVLSALSTDQG